MKQGSSRRGTFHEGVAPGAYHQENTRKKAEVEKDDFYFQEGNGQKKSLVEPRSFATLGGTPGLRQSAQWVIWRSGNTLVRDLCHIRVFYDWEEGENGFLSWLIATHSQYLPSK